MFSRLPAMLFSLGCLLEIRQHVWAMRVTLSDEDLTEGLNTTGVAAVGWSNDTGHGSKYVLPIVAGTSHKNHKIHHVNSLQAVAGTHAEELEGSTFWNHPLRAEYRGQVMEFRIVTVLMVVLLLVAMWVLPNWYMDMVNPKGQSTSKSVLSNDALIVGGKLEPSAGNTDPTSKALAGLVQFKKAAKWPCWFTETNKSGRIERIKVEADRLIRSITLRRFLVSSPTLHYEFDDWVEGGWSDEEDAEEPEMENEEDELDEDIDMSMPAPESSSPASPIHESKEETSNEAKQTDLAKPIGLARYCAGQTAQVPYHAQLRFT